MDVEAGEFWVENPYKMPGQAFNLSAYERNRLFLNLDGRSFLDASFASRVDIDADSRAVVAADFDGNGTPDLLVASVGGGPLRLFLNRFPSSAGHLRLTLAGIESNRAGIGARVVAEVGGRRLVRDMFLANGGTGLGPAEVHLGLGSAKKVDRLSVRWPTGTTQQFSGLPANSRVTLIEDSPDYRATPLPRSGKSVPG
jgi:hypothetical protein